MRILPLLGRREHKMAEKLISKRLLAKFENTMGRLRENGGGRVV